MTRSDTRAQAFTYSLEKAPCPPPGDGVEGGLMGLADPPGARQLAAGDGAMVPATPGHTNEHAGAAARSSA